MRTLAEFTKTTLIKRYFDHPADLHRHAPAGEGGQRIARDASTSDGAAPGRRRVPAAAAILLLIAVCFVVGLVVRSGPGLRAKNAFEQAVLEKLPGYTFAWRRQRLTARSEEHTLEPALVEIEDALVPALIVEKLEDGSYTVLIPSAPTPMAGSIYILPADRVHPVDIPFTKAIGVFSKWGQAPVSSCGR